MNRLEIRQLSARAHGYTGERFPIGAGSISIKGVGQSASGLNHLGKPYFMDFFVRSGGVNQRLPNEPLVSLSGQNRIVKTVIVGGDRSGTVKECIGADDWKISLAGICINAEAPLAYPYEQVEQLKGLKEARGSIGVENDLLRLFGIYNMVIESLYLDDMIGIPYAQKYKITALSDEDFLAERKSESRARALAKGL